MARRKISDSINEVVGSDANGTGKNTILKEEKRVGRPAKEPVAKISLAIPKRIMEQIGVAAIAKAGGNRTQYIISLIESDLKLHKEEYKKVAALIEKEAR